MKYVFRASLLFSVVVIVVGCSIKTPRFEPVGSRNHKKCFKLNNCIIKTSKLGKSALSIQKNTAVTMNFVEEKLIESDGNQRRVFDLLLTVSNRSDMPLSVDLKKLPGHLSVEKIPLLSLKRSAFPYKQSAVLFALASSPKNVGVSTGLSRDLDNQFDRYNLNLYKIFDLQHKFASKAIKSATIKPKKTIAGRVFIGEEGVIESLEEDGSKQVVLKIPVDNDLHTFYLRKQPKPIQSASINES